MITEWGSRRPERPRRGVANGVHAHTGPDGPAARNGTELLRWHVLQTRSRQEKAVAELLDGDGASPFLPVVRRVTHYGHRKRTVELPLFSSYVFVWGTLDHTYKAIASKRVVRAVPVTDQATLSYELEQIRRAIGGEAELSPYRFLEKGVRVRVTSGPFKDLEGLVDETVRNDRLILQIRTLGRATSLEIDASLLERL